MFLLRQRCCLAFKIFSLISLLRQVVTHYERFWLEPNGILSWNVFLQSRCTLTYALVINFVRSII